VILGSMKKKERLPRRKGKTKECTEKKSDREAAQKNESCGPDCARRSNFWQKKKPSRKGRKKKVCNKGGENLGKTSALPGKRGTTAH